MTITSKYNLGDTVYIINLKSKKIEQKKVYKISLYYTDRNNKILYTLGDTNTQQHIAFDLLSIGSDYEEHEISSTIEEAIDTLHTILQSTENTKHLIGL